MIAVQPNSCLAQGDQLMDVIIRPEIADDFPVAREVVRLAFPDEDVAGLLEVLRGSEEYLPELALVAVRDGELSGHVMFTTSPIDNAGESIPALTLGPLAVHPKLQRQGVGSQLVEEGLAICRRLGHRIVIVIGHSTYYPRFGFVPAGPLGIEVPFDADEESKMVLALTSGALEGIRGRVRFSPVVYDA